ncbi:hypothetical protein AX17_002794 [Amanita inopinata Kibby_2008]|nr:hypothetical protein AX17_002794 [Amanita inopinata Kibby_2008]
MDTSTVQNGGTLTNTESDFYKAQFFFCNDSDDPWLPERLIIRHPVWITQCVSEEFVVPIAPFTLDSPLMFFQGTLLVESLKANTLRILELYSNPDNVFWEDPKDVTEATVPTDKIRDKTRPRKRSLEEGSVERLQIAKRPRIYIPNTPESPPTPSERWVPSAPRSHCRSPSVVSHLSPEGKSKSFDSFLAPSICSYLALAKEAEMHQETEAESIDVSGSLVARNLQEHQAFWRGLCNKHCPAGLLSLSVEDVLRAPTAPSIMLSRNKQYLGKPIRVKIKAFGNLGPGKPDADTTSESNTAVHFSNVTLNDVTGIAKKVSSIKSNVQWLNLNKFAKSHRRSRGFKIQMLSL